MEIRCYKCGREVPNKVQQAIAIAIVERYQIETSTLPTDFGIGDVTTSIAEKADRIPGGNGLPVLVHAHCRGCNNHMWFRFFARGSVSTQATKADSNQSDQIAISF